MSFFYSLPFSTMTNFNFLGGNNNSVIETKLEEPNIKPTNSPENNKIKPILDNINFDYFDSNESESIQLKPQLKPLLDDIELQPLLNNIQLKPMLDDIISKYHDSANLSEPTKPTNETILSEPINETILSEPNNETILSEPNNETILSEPINESVLSGTVLSEPINQTVLSETILSEPIFSESINKPILFEQINETILSEQTNGTILSEQIPFEPINKTVLSELIPSEPNNKTILFESTNETVNDTTLSESNNKTVFLEPVNETTLSEPINQTILSGTILSEPINQTILSESTNETILSEPVNETILSEPVNETILSEPATNVTSQEQNNKINNNILSKQYKLELIKLNTSKLVTTIPFNRSVFLKNLNGLISCYNENTSILCFVGGKEVEIHIKNIQVGTLVKTYLHGYKKIVLKESCTFINDKYNDITTRIYQYGNLIITGGHSCLVDNVTDEEKKYSLRKIDGKYLLLSHADKRFTQIIDNQVYTVYHIALENSNMDGQYGIYANGVLSETMSINVAKLMASRRKIKKL